MFDRDGEWAGVGVGGSQDTANLIWGVSMSSDQINIFQSVLLLDGNQ